MSVHPALLTKFRGQIAKADEDDLIGLVGWESFEPDEKKFLAVFGWFGHLVPSRHKNFYQTITKRQMNSLHHQDVSIVDC